MNSINYDSSLTQLVSYPRTGSHYFRIVVEECIKRPCAPTSFLGYCEKEPWGFHLHDRIVGRGDEGVTGGFNKVIYLYRNPIDTIYSHMVYQQLEDWKFIAEEYKIHLQRWLYNSNDCKKIISIEYDDLIKNPLLEFNKFFAFINCEVREDILEDAIKRTTIERVKSLTENLDSKVIDKNHFSGIYSTSKSMFVSQYSHIIKDIFKEVYQFKS
jgi:hypothetical protein